MIRDQPSEFKQALLDLKPGMSILMRGPVGPFYLKDEKPALLIAGGIGITPFRAMLKQFEVEGSRQQRIQLLYMDSNKRYLFQDELDQVAERTSLNVTYLDSRDQLNQEIDKYVGEIAQTGNVYIAGPKSMVDTLTGELQARNISKKQLIKDSFYGY